MSLQLSHTGKEKIKIIIIKIKVIRRTRSGSNISNLNGVNLVREGTSKK